jgi:hypothetical protein
MRRSISFLVLALATVGLVAVLAPPSQASWVSTHCAPNHASDSNYRRKDALVYANVARYEGYQWGGGCWNNDDIDNTPKDPPEQYTYGEGPDCSGFTFKTWELKSAKETSGFTWYDKLEYIHGPYSSGAFHAPLSADPFFILANKNRSTTMYMDAFGKVGHIGMLWTSANPSSNTDYIIEALGEFHGTNVWAESYRYDSLYLGIRREAWTPDCWPYCQSPAAVPVVALP